MAKSFKVVVIAFFLSIQLCGCMTRIASEEQALTIETQQEITKEKAITSQNVEVDNLGISAEEAKHSNLENNDSIFESNTMNKFFYYVQLLRSQEDISKLFDNWNEWAIMDITFESAPPCAYLFKDNTTGLMYGISVSEDDYNEQKRYLDGDEVISSILGKLEDFFPDIVWPNTDVGICVFLNSLFGKDIFDGPYDWDTYSGYLREHELTININPIDGMLTSDGFISIHYGGDN